MSDQDSDRIQLDSGGPMRVTLGETAIAATDSALSLAERGHPARLYVPREDVHTNYLRVSATRTHCPFKGDATYYDVIVGDQTLTDAAWSYEQPQNSMAKIARHLAFDHPQLTLHF